MTAQQADNRIVPEPTAAEVLALSALAAGNPMTASEMQRAVADMGMYLDTAYVAAILYSLSERGLAEQTAAVSLGKFRSTAQGRAWLASRTASDETRP